MKKLNFSELKIGTKVKDNEGNQGTIQKINSIHNIAVKLETGTGGYAFYCLDASCRNLYDPLYSLE